ncbi:MAG: MFS transporter [Acidobacteriota bacterium]
MPATHKPERFAWFVIALLFAGSVVNYVDRAVLGVLMPQIRRDLSLTNTDYALAVNAFLVTYMVFYILGGRLADRLGYRWSFVISIVFWSLASMAHTMVAGLRSLALARALLGIGEGGYYPAAMRGAAEWFPPEHRAKAVGLLLSALSVGTLLTPPVVAWITVRYGWRAAFLVTGALGFLLVPPWLALHRSAPAARPHAAAGDPRHDDVPLGAVLSSRKYWCMLAARANSDAAWYFYLFWMPGYFQEVRGLSLQAVGQFLWIPYFGAGVGALAGAWASSALIRRGLPLDRSRKSVLLVSALLSTTGAAACFVPGPALAVALVSLALFAHQSWSSNIHTAITEITPPKHVAVLYGITGAAGTGMGALAQLVIGPVVDSYGYQPVFLWAGLAYVLAAALLLAAGRIEPISSEEFR